MTKNKKIELRVTEKEKNKIFEMAEMEKLKVSEFILSRIFTASNRAVSNRLSSFEFEIISVRDYPNLKMSYSQIKLIIEAINIYMDYVFNSNNSKKNIEYENANNIYMFLQDMYNYNYEDAFNKCFNKFAKKYLENDSPGQETFSWLNM